MTLIVVVLQWLWLHFRLKKIENNQYTIFRKQDHTMAAVQIEQDDLDNVASTLETLVTAISEIDTSVLPAADQTRLQAAVTGVTDAVNSKLPIDVPTGEGAV